MAALFPAAAACQENASGPLEVPDHPIVTQTLHDTMTEALDLAGLQALLADIEAGRVTVSTRDTTEPSPLAHELVSGKPYTYLDDAPLEERRTRAVTLRRGLPVDLSEIGAVDADAIERVRAEVRPDPRNADELADLLAGLVALRGPAGLAAVVRRARRAWAGARALPRGAALVGAGRTRWTTSPRCGRRLEHRRRRSASRGRPGSGTAAGRRRAAALDAVGGRLEVTGPATVDELGRDTGLAAGTVAIAPCRAGGAGRRHPGHVQPARRYLPIGLPIGLPSVEAVEWCARRLLQRIHVYSQKRRRREIEPVSARDFMRFLFRWHHVTAGYPATGRRRAARRRRAAAGVGGGRRATGSRSCCGPGSSDYRPSLLDQRCHAGDVVWAPADARADSGDADAGWGRRRAGGPRPGTVPGDADQPLRPGRPGLVAGGRPGGRAAGGADRRRAGRGHRGAACRRRPLPPGARPATPAACPPTSSGRCGRGSPGAC